MNLPRSTARSLRLPFVPLANVALLMFVALALAGMFSGMRGVGFRFEGSGRPATAAPQETTPVVAARTVGAGEVPPVILRIEGDGRVLLESAPVAPEALAAALGARLDASPGAMLLLDVAPEASYQAFVDVAARLLLPGEASPLHGHVFSIPTRRDLTAWKAAQVSPP